MGAALAAALLMLLSSTASARYWHWIEFSQPRQYGDYLHNIRTDRLHTPCLPFAKPLAGGPVRALFVVTKAGVAPREVVEMWQRLDLEFEAVTVADAERLCDWFPLTTAVLGESPEEKTRELDRKLDGDYDVIVLAPFRFDKLPPKAQLKILQKMKRGTGLLGFGATARGDQSMFRPLHPPVTGREILRGCALTGLPYFEVGAKGTRDEVADRQLFTARFGSGRLAWLNYSAPHYINSWYMGDTIGRPASPAPCGMVAPSWQTYDAAIAPALRTLLWAAGRVPAVQVDAGIPDGAAIDRATWPATFSATLTRLSAEAPAQVAVEARLVRPDGQFEDTAKITVPLPGNDAVFTLKLGPPPRGTAFLWLIARDPQGAVLDWSVTSVLVTASVAVESVQIQQDVIEPGEDLPARVVLAGTAPEGATLTLDAFDCYDRLFWSRQVPAAAAATFTVGTSAMCGRAGRLRARMQAGPQLLDSAETEFFVRKPVGREFINLLWGHPGVGVSDWQTRGYLNQLHVQGVRRGGWNVGMATYSNPAATVRAMSRADAATFYYVTHVQQPNVRTYLSDPEARPKEEERLEKTAADVRPYGCMAYSLGDENGMFTSPVDMKPGELAAFRAFLARLYDGDLEAMNRNWQTNYTDFSQAEVPAEGVAKLPVPRRFDLDAFWDWAYADTHHWMAQALKRGDPEALVGAEGSWARNLEEVIAGLDWWAPYEDRNTNTMLRFWMPWSALRGNWWGTYPDDRLGPEHLWRQLATGSVNSSMFFISPSGLFGMDFEFAEDTLAWVPMMREICEGPGPLIRAASPVDDGVGIFYSRLSDAASEFDNRFGSSRTEQTALLDLCDRLGVSAKFLTEQQILAGQLDPRTTKLLILCQPKAVTDGLAPALERYLQAGGVVVADVALDLRGDHCQDVPPGRLLSLFGAGSAEPKPGTAEVAFKTELLGVPLALSARECLVDAGVGVGTGAPLAQAGGHPILIHRQHGRGLALLLNFDLYHAFGEARNPEAVTTPAGDFLLALLKLGGAGPMFPPAAGLPWRTIREMRLADATLVGLHGYLGPPGPRIFQVGEGRRVHPLRSGCGTDAEGALTLPAKAPDTLLFSVLPTTRRELRLAGAGEAKRGDFYDYQAVLSVGGKLLAESLLRVDVLDPQGKPLDAHREFLLTRGRPLGLRWPVALNATPGNYRLRVTEIVSGTAGELSVAVK